MFSHEPRVRYGLSQLGDVICQLRFPEILAISDRSPVDFQEAIREEYPQFQRRTDAPPPRITGGPGSFSLQNQPGIVNYQFSSADGVWRVNLTSRFISLTCARYTCWEDFCRKLDKPLAAFIQIYKPAYFERVGLRYLNLISRSQLGLEDVPFSRLIQSCYLGPLGEEDVQPAAVARCTIDTEMGLRGNCRAKIHAGPGLVKRGGKEDKEVKFIFDQDLYHQSQLPVHMTAGILQTLHMHAESIFRGAITDTLHEAMEPEE